MSREDGSAEGVSVDGGAAGDTPRRVVVKVGSSTVSDRGGRIDRAFLERLVAQIAAVRERGSDVVLVSSGAIAAGMEALGLDTRPSDMAGLQAAAAVGQPRLIEAYESGFARHGASIAQVLLTRHETAHRRQYVFACRTLERLLELGVVAVVNENDTTAVEEIRFGDNDSLAALVAMMIKADLVVMLTDIEGVYDADPRSSDAATLMEHVDEVTDALIHRAGGSTGSGLGSGGMYSKIEAARMLMKAGITTVVADGRREHVVEDVVAGRRIGTRFTGKEDALTGRKLWIAFGGHARGVITVDEGARAALMERQSSLLPAGVVAVEGDFTEGDSVTITTVAGEPLGRGLAEVSAADLRKVMGLRTDRIREVLPTWQGAEVVHRDHLVIL